MDSEDMFVEAEKGEIADDAALGEGELGPAQLVEQLTGAELDTQLHSISLHCSNSSVRIVQQDTLLFPE